MATTPPGWYDDGRGALRWWDGSQWTEHVQTPDPEPEGDPDAGPSSASDEAMDTLLAPAVAPAPTLESAAMTDAAPPASAEAQDVVADGGDTPSAPPGYPGGFPGGPAPSGGFIAATERKKSKLWILWVVVGVILLGFVILAAVLIPVLIGMFGSAGGSGTGSGSDNEAAAVAAVELYDEAWATADCTKFEQSTTLEFREVLELADCGLFTAASQEFTDSVDDYAVEVTAVESTEDRITVETTETFTSLIDDQGNQTDEPIAYEEHYSYVVVPSEGGWAINEANDADAG